VLAVHTLDVGLDDPLSQILHTLLAGVNPEAELSLEDLPEQRMLSETLGWVGLAIDL
jgi:hypothetical protein